MKTSKKKVPSILSMAFLFLSVSLTATDGYFSLGFGAKHKGVAGAGVGLHHFSLLNGNNAGLAELGNAYQVGVAIFNPNRKYTISGQPSGQPGTLGLTPGEVKSESTIFFIPNIAANWMIDENSSLGVSIFGQGGMNTDYPTQTFYDQTTPSTGVNLSQLLSNISYSRKLGEMHSLGLSAVVAFQMFEAEGLSNFAPFSEDPQNLTNNGVSTSFGFGFKVGYLGHLTDVVSLGATYQSKLKMSAFDKYAGLFAEQGSFDIPGALSVGVGIDLSDKVTLMADYKRIFYGSVNSIANPINPGALPPAFLNPNGNPNNPNDYTPNPNHVPLGSENGSGFGWQDMDVFKVGFMYTTTDWVWRAGFSAGSNPVPSSEVLFNILAPGVIDQHIAFGLSKLMSNGHSVDFSINYALNNVVSGNNSFDPGQTIDLEMNQWDFEINYSF